MLRSHAFGIILMGALMLSLTGCGQLIPEDEQVKIVFTTGFDGGEIFRIEDATCSSQEMMVYIINTQQTYAEKLGTEILDAEVDGESMETLIKESCLSRLAQIKTMGLLADEKGIELTSAEEELAAKAAQSYYESLSEEELVSMRGVTQDQLEEMFMDFARADKLYQYTIQDINPEISDDEARTITVEQIFISKETEDAASTIQAIRRELGSSDASFETLAEKYNEAEDVTISFGKGEMDIAIEEAAFNLATDEVSSVIITEDGFYLLKCLTTFNRAETEANKVRIVEQRKKEAFGQQYEEFAANLTPELNEELWAEITLPETVDASATSFFDVYDAYFGE